MDGCNLCRGLLYDYICLPLMPCEPLSNRVKVERVKRCASEISESILYIFSKIPQDEYAQLMNHDTHYNGPYYIQNPMKLNDQETVWFYHRNIRLYFNFNMRYKGISAYIDTIVTILREHCILKNCCDSYCYEEWLAQKIMWGLQNIGQIHSEHLQSFLR